ncbi:glycosyltransferase family 39 protein [Acidiphilium sp. AL]|uniref:Glycosyltransferase family 39 protein n=1 Tax=Acidiphilium iwatense TaxID=768198 RepID=A0ABS9E4Q2_9PROT|nr:MULTISPECIES: glycosyltransferase family 39 protein [Acidiphilium]MCF3948627.1 glycosyltransferase family 39 protein [Acidiphilium iwatense]MCU4161380.1 glycosyltransferase family 39 protein [Acidiphilium sp. AL]
MKSASPARQAAVVILLATVIRLILAGGMGLGIDESYMVSASHAFQLSYFDHPPISWWMELAIQRVTGLHGPLIVRLPFIMLFAGTSALMYGFASRLFGARAALWAVIGLNISPVFSVAFGTWVLPDGPLDFFLVAAAWALSRAVGVARPELDAEPEPGFWPLAGLFAGLAMTSKYNAALNLLGALLFLAFDARGRRALASAGPWIACLIALLVFSPVLIWNALNAWVSFGYQGARATGIGIHPLRPFIVWAGEALFIAPWIWVPMAWLLVEGLRHGADRRARFLALLAIIPVTLFSVIAFWSARKILYHWAAPGYLMLFPLLGDWVARLGNAARRWVGAVTAGTAGLLTVATLFIAAELSFGIVPGFNALFPPGHSPELQAVDWRSFRETLARRGDLDWPDLAIAALRWYDAGKIAYAIGPGVPVAVFEGDPHEFGITTPPQSLIGENVLIAAMPGSEAAIMRRYAPRFRSITVAKPIDITHHGRVLLKIPMLLGHDLRSWPAAASR